jgi:heat-inducible transcriptional repressor
MIKNITMDERESSVLIALVYEYILTGKPVGSRSFVQKYSFSISPATMRNIMFDLEGSGYLLQPHTSAGRIPTDKGYRFYVDSLLDTYESVSNEDVKVKEEAIKREVQLEKIFSYIIRMLSQYSKYSGIMLSPKTGFSIIKRIELVPLDAGEILFILVTRTGTVVNRKVYISANITQDSLYEYSRYLSAELSGYAIREIKDGIYDMLKPQSTSSSVDMNIALDIVKLALTEDDEPALLMDGIENLLRIPEMVEDERLKSLLNIIEEKDILKNILEQSLDNDGVRTIIGKEITGDKISGCSVVSTSYKIGNKNVGVIGVMGPTRMDYKKVVPLVDYAGRVVSDFLTKMSK